MYLDDTNINYTFINAFKYVYLYLMVQNQDFSQY